MNCDSQLLINKNEFISLREDIFDRFYSIVKSIEEENIKTNIEYQKYLKLLLQDFKLYTIMLFINELTNDIEFKKYYNSYKIALNYCEEIYNRIKDFEQNLIKKKID
jgi:hypothetical protein